LISDEEDGNTLPHQSSQHLPRFVPIKRSSGSVRRRHGTPYHHYFVWLEQLIAANLDALFPGMEVLEVHPFRVTRDADLEIQELEADDLLESMEESVRPRRFGEVVRVTINDDMPAHVREILIENLETERNDIYSSRGHWALAVDAALWYRPP
jgi:polyphosphate kinase